MGFINDPLCLHMKEVSNIAMVFMIFFSVLAVAASVWYFFKITEGQNTKKQLTSLFMFCLIVLIGVFMVDKIIGIRSSLLNDAENSMVFELIKGFMWAVLGATFKTDETRPGL